METIVCNALKGLGFSMLEIGDVFGQSSQDIYFVHPNEEKRYLSAGVYPQSVIMALMERNRYLYDVIGCVETDDAYFYLEENLNLFQCSGLFNISTMRLEETLRVLDAGHLYGISQNFGNPHVLTFIKRSGGAIKYEKEWPGVQSQEVARALIRYTSCAKEITEPLKTEICDNFRKFIFMYEVRAYRRKVEKVNRLKPAHNDSISPKAWRENNFSDVPFNWGNIEQRSIGKDGHILVG